MTAFCDIAPCSLIVVDRCFRREYCLHHHGADGRIALMMEAEHTSETWVYFNKIHGPISQKAVIFEITAVRN
jgi:hypothetical protein